MSERTCEYCEKPFTPKRPTRRFCSKACSTRSWRNNAEYARLLAEGKKQCSKCEEIKSLENFHRRTGAGRGGWVSRCKGCISAYYAKHNAKDHVRERKRELKLAQRYGITLEEYDRMLANQGHRCVICQREHNDAQGPLHVDHCHATGQIRGLLCRSCNTAIGAFEDDRRRLIAAAAYLERNST